MKIFLLLPLLLGFSVPVLAHNEANGGLVPLPGMGKTLGMGEMPVMPEKACPSGPTFNYGKNALTKTIVDYKGRRCSSATCITVRNGDNWKGCLLYTSPSPRDGLLSRMPSSA